MPSVRAGSRMLLLIKKGNSNNLLVLCHQGKEGFPWLSIAFRTDFNDTFAGMSGIVNILPWIVSFLIALGIVAMQAIGGGGRPMFPLMVCYGPIVVAGILSIPLIFLGNNRRAPDRNCLGATLAFGSYLLLRTCFGGDPGLRDFELLRLSACFLVYLLTLAAVTEKGPRLFFVGILLAAAFLQTAAESYQFYCDQSWSPLLEGLPFLKTYYSETVGTYANKNHLAWLLGGGALFAIALASWGRLRWITRGLLLYLFFFLGFGVCISLSRGGLVALIVGLVVLALVSVLLLLFSGDRGKLLSGILIILLVSSLAAGAFALLSNNPALGLRMKGLWMDDYREDLWRAAIHDLGNAPFFGMGAGSFQWCARLMMPVESLLAHNDYAQLLSEYGLMGFLLLIVFLVGHLRAGFSTLFRHSDEGGRSGSSGDSKAVLLGALAIITAQMVHSAFDFNTHLASNALLAAFCIGILGGDGLHGGHRPVSRAMRVLQCAFVVVLAGFSSCILIKDWGQESRFFCLEQSLTEAALSSGQHSLVQASVEANRLLSEVPDSTRYADLRASLYRTMLSRPESEYNEPADRIMLRRQLDLALPLSGGDWYLWTNHSFLLGHLGDEVGAREAFLQAMVRMPLYSMVYGDYAAVMEFQGESIIALHYAHIASRFKDTQGMESLVRRLEEKTAGGVHP